MLPVYILLLILPITGGGQKASARLAAERREFADNIRQLQKELREGVAKYKESLKQLVVTYEEARERAARRMKQTQTLYDENLARRRDLEESKTQLAEAESRLADARSRLEHADDTVQDLEDPDELARRLITQPAKRERTPKGRVYFVRFIMIGEIAIYDYTGAVSGRVIKQGQRVRYDSRRK